MRGSKYTTCGVVAAQYRARLTLCRQFSPLYGTSTSVWASPLYKIEQRPPSSSLSSLLKTISSFCSFYSFATSLSIATSYLFGYPVYYYGGLLSFASRMRTAAHFEHNIFMVELVSLRLPSYRGSYVRRYHPYPMSSRHQKHNNYIMVGQFRYFELQNRIR